MNSAGIPPADVIAWALIGGLVSVWAGTETVVVMSLQWIGKIITQLAVSAVVGIVLAAIILAVAPHYEVLAWVGWAPHWALAAALSASAFRLGPPVLARLASLIGGKNA
jgi:hypothetical protein